MKVFHGSDHVVKLPVYLIGKSDNDYGNGFYTTEYEDRARSWAVLNGSPVAISEGGAGLCAKGHMMNVIWIV